MTLIFFLVSLGVLVLRLLWCMLVMAVYAQSDYEIEAWLTDPPKEKKDR